MCTRARQMRREYGWLGTAAGTGAINMGFFLMEAPDGSFHSYAGPVMSYYEYVSTNSSASPMKNGEAPCVSDDSASAWVNLYLADTTGGSKGADHRSLPEWKCRRIPRWQQRHSNWAPITRIR